VTERGSAAPWRPAVSPLVSVVMAVHDEEAEVAASVDSVLAQAGVTLELVIVDDGSGDGTARVLGGYAADPRVRVLQRPRSGLTAALIAGCAAARGELIARQDAGDSSLPGRLARQARALAADPRSVLASCHARVLAPGGEAMHEVRPEPGWCRDIETHGGRDEVRTPLHPTMMFRRAAYEAAGGYRPQFALAQDVDLLLRLAEQGGHAVVAEDLYEVRWRVRSLSSRSGREQRRLRALAIACARRRRAGAPEDDLLAQARRVPVPERPAGGAAGDAAALYFIGSCLLARGHGHAARYLEAAVRRNPLHLKAWSKLAHSRLRGERRAGSVDAG